MSFLKVASSKYVVTPNFLRHIDMNFMFLFWIQTAHITIFISQNINFIFVTFTSTKVKFFSNFRSERSNGNDNEPIFRVGASLQKKPIICIPGTVASQVETGAPLSMNVLYSAYAV